MSQWWMDDSSLDDALSQLGAPAAATPVVGPEQILAKAAGLAPPAATVTGLTGWKLLATLASTAFVGFGGGMIVENMRVSSPPVPQVEELVMETTPSPEEAATPPVAPEANAPKSEQEQSAAEPPAEETASEEANSSSSHHSSSGGSGPISATHSPTPSSSTEGQQESMVAAVEDEPPETPQEPLIVPQLEEKEQEKVAVMTAKEPKSKKKKRRKHRTARIKGMAKNSTASWKLTTSGGFRSPVREKSPNAAMAGIGIVREGDDTWYSRSVIRADMGVAPGNRQWKMLPAAQLEIGGGRRWSSLKSDLSWTMGVHQVARLVAKNQDTEQATEGVKAEPAPIQAKSMLLMGPQVRVGLGEKMWVSGQYQRHFNGKKDAYQAIELRVGMDFPL